MNPDKANFVANLAHTLVQNNATMRVSTLAELLNENHYLTEYGTEYEGGRGTYKFLSSLYSYFMELGNNPAADEIASAFVKADGNYAYE